MDFIIDKLFTQHELSSLRGEAPTPLYYQMYTLLKNRILDGSIAHGTQMPTEQQLAEAFNVSRITAKRAMDELAAEELVERRRGKGTHVTHHYDPEPVHAPLTGMLEKLASMGRDTKVRVLDIGMLVPPGDIRVELGLDGDDKAHRVIRVRSAEDGEPFAHYISWTVGLERGFSMKDLETRVRYDVMKENGFEVTRIDQSMTAVPAQEFVANELDMKVGEPVLKLTRRSYTEAGRLVDILYCHYNPKRFHYRMSISMDDYRG
ncbi:GntR family transcriptional regulator [Oceanicoccus sp. KOV_DT_Chl]|uniref:GntR family transcriptional regulator n=1 Tax=Oceanicoccus sp. KOV_DT_Chl TaxID=1904639 RepID=UPI000C7C1170|nr:GntR family transcriptional regulator [Oceanicoccus sp. KOV_DT_Chl]